MSKHEHTLTLEQVLLGLLADGIITPANAAQIRQDMPGTTTLLHPLIAIANRQWQHLKTDRILTLESLTEWLAQHVGLPYINIDPLKIDVPSVTSVISYGYASRFKILPIKVEPNLITIATAEPYIREWERDLANTLRLKFQRVIVNPADINRYLDEFYGLTHSIKKATQDKAPGVNDGLGNLEQLVELGKMGKLDANDHHIVHIVDWLLQYAFEQRASDIHLEPRRDTSNIRFRIDGHLQVVYKLPTTVMAAITSRIKALGRMDVIEKRRPQDGRMKTKTPRSEEVELRLSTMPTAFGEKMVLRIFDPEVADKTYEQLGFSKHDIYLWNEMVSHSHGIILVTGPTGSGKTTTLYSTLKRLAKPDINVCTIEDPIEMIESNFNQMQVNPKIHLDFGVGIRTLLRQDPDIIMIGEIRDLETSQMSIQAALTGHLVLSSLHTNDAPSAITRLLDIGAPAHLINATLRGIVAQRLVRVLCPHCKIPGVIEDELWDSLVKPWNFPKPTKSYQPVGCLECRKTGFLGRIGIYETLLLNTELRALIQPGSTPNILREQAIKDKMVPLRIAGAQKVIAGVTTVEEVLKVAPPELM